VPSLNYLFLASDLDGTLLFNNQVSDINRKSIEKFQSLGGSFTIASGRNYNEAKHIIEQLNISLPVILCNGAVLYDPKLDEIIPIKTLDVKLAIDIACELDVDFVESDVFVFTIDQIYATKVSPYTLNITNTNDFRIQVISSFREIPQQQIIKIVTITKPENMSSVINHIEQKKWPTDYVQTGDDFFEIVPQGASKGKAISHVLRELQIPNEKAAAIGDHCNDLSMAEHVGLFAAVSNSHPSTLEKANLIVPSNMHDGVAHLITNHLIHPSQV
jgi:Cof subfamily protein (haloacid dehalogenase superfamily)